MWLAGGLDKAKLWTFPTLTGLPSVPRTHLFGWDYLAYLQIRWTKGRSNNLLYVREKTLFSAQKQLVSFFLESLANTWTGQHGEWGRPLHSSSKCHSADARDINMICKSIYLHKATRWTAQGGPCKHVAKFKQTMLHQKTKNELTPRALATTWPEMDGTWTAAINAKDLSTDAQQQKSGSPLPKFSKCNQFENQFPIPSKLQIITRQEILDWF